jgi:hypothetical protein
MKTEHKFNLLQTWQAYLNCANDNNPNGRQEWTDRHWERITTELLEALPHGSGIDYDWRFYTNNGKDLICANGYHWMNENGMYCGTIDFTVTIKGSVRDMFGKLIFKIVGRFGKHQDIKDYLYEIIGESFGNDTLESM